MLTLKGKTNDRFFIGDNVTVKILEARGGVVRLGFSAPPDIPIDRAKVREAKVRNGNAPAPDGNAPAPDGDSHRLDGEGTPC